MTHFNDRPDYSDKNREGIVNLHCDSCDRDTPIAARYAGSLVACSCGVTGRAAPTTRAELARILSHYHSAPPADVTYLD